jgi:hypothetical protein
VGSGVCPRAMRCVLRAEYVRCCSASYCMVCTARSGRLGKAPPRAAATGCSEGWIGGWPQFQLLRNPATTKTSRDPSLSPTALLARCNPQDMAKCEHAARVLCLRKDRRLRLLTGCLCRPQLRRSITPIPSTITTACLSALHSRAWSTASLVVGES